jgi:transcriptional regulator with XRE-family HTH domain
VTKFGDRLRIAIEHHQCISLTQFAQNAGISPQNLSHYLSGQRKPGLDSLADMIKVLPGTNVTWLITGDIK